VFSSAETTVRIHQSGDTNSNNQHSKNGSQQLCSDGTEVIRIFSLNNFNIIAV
jgi:hypothetical protein